VMSPSVLRGRKEKKKKATPIPPPCRKGGKRKRGVHREGRKRHYIYIKLYEERKGKEGREKYSLHYFLTSSRGKKKGGEGGRGFRRKEGGSDY